MTFAHYDATKLQLVRWQSKPPTLPNDTEDGAVRAVADTMRTVDAEGPQPAPSTQAAQRLKRHQLTDAARQAGVHTLSWSAWRHPSGTEDTVARVITDLNAKLCAMTGLTGPVLGLGGLVRLSLDDTTSSSAPTVQAHRQSYPVGKAQANMAGSFRLSLDKDPSVYDLAHGWLHALDYAVALNTGKPLLGHTAEWQRRVGPEGSADAQQRLAAFLQTVCASPDVQSCFSSLVAPAPDGALSTQMLERRTRRALSYPVVPKSPKHP